MTKLFLLKDKLSEEVFYLNSDVGKFECGHYFGKIKISNTSTLSDINSVGSVLDDYGNVTTSVLDENDLRYLIDVNKKLNELGYGIEVNSELYHTGVQLVDSIQPIIEKLRGEENKNLFKMVQAEEVEKIVNEYDVTEEQAWDILDNYDGDYKDSSIIGTIYTDSNEMASEYVWSTGMFDSSVDERYINFEAIAEDLLEDYSNYYELDCGRIVSYVY